MANLKIIHAGNSTVRGAGKYRDDRSLSDLISYCTNPLKTVHGYIGAFGVNPSWAAEQMQYLTLSYGKNFGRRARHMILSFDTQEAINAYDANQIAYRLALWYSNKYQILWAVHEDTDNIHIHFVMNTTSYLDGRKYRGEKYDYYEFRAYVAKILFTYGCKLEMAQ